MRKIGFKLVLSMLLFISTLMIGFATPVLAADVGTVTANTLTVRKGPGTGYSAVMYLDKGTNVNILSKDGGWMQISYSGKKGYVSASYIKTSSSSTASSTKVNTGNTLRRGDTGSDVVALQKNLKTLKYFSGTATGTYGSVTEQAVIKFQKACGLTADGVAGPATLSKLQQKLNGGTSSTTTSSSSVTGRTDVTLKMGSSGSEVTNLQKALKNKGYMSANATGYFGSATRSAVIAFQKANGLGSDGIAGSKTLTALYGKSSTASSGKTYSTMRQGDSSDKVKDLQKALKKKGYFNTDATGYYGTVTVQAVKKFQKANGLSADGVAGPKTLEKLGFTVSSSSAASKINKNGKVEMADWWTVVSKAFARGEKAVVTDMKTGLSYEVKRYGGSNHADVEPVTAADTAIMKKIYGGSWSWSRRAVWVTVDGNRTFAGSINGMPHGGGSLSYNNFSGHSCIHFLNSRTHGTNKVDSQHQNAVKTAYKNASKFK